MDDATSPRSGDGRGRRRGATGARRGPEPTGAEARKPPGRLAGAAGEEPAGRSGDRR